VHPCWTLNIKNSNIFFMHFVYIFGKINIMKNRISFTYLIKGTVFR